MFLFFSLYFNCNYHTCNTKQCINIYILINISLLIIGLYFYYFIFNTIKNNFIFKKKNIFKN